MKARDYDRLGIPRGPLRKLANRAAADAAHAGIDKQTVREIMRSLVASPKAYMMDEHFGALATALSSREEASSLGATGAPRAPYQIWGEGLEKTAVQQMENACSLPVAVRGALMPDAHVGYGLPIGGVLATRDAVIPYAVGVDIACRMKMTVLDLPLSVFERDQDRLKNAIARETRFGVGASFRRKRDHAVMDDKAWQATSFLRHLRDKAWAQLGTSGSGNHFVEFGVLTFPQADLGLDAGNYVALLSHSGSRGAGHAVAEHYSRVARDRHPELPKSLQHLAWLHRQSSDGQAYWLAMNLMGRYAAANHELVHRHMARNLGVRVLLDIENHHNFAWEEEHSGERLVVHRKGATPAGKGAVGIIPGSMATSGYVVRGKGHERALCSAAHGAGRVMSRKAAKQKFRWHHARPMLQERGVKVISAGLDEVPMVYKDIEEVMGFQQDMVERVARFDPRLVKMAPGRERPED